MSKYHAVRTGKYASKKEARRAEDLKLLEQIGEISDLREQVRIELIPAQQGERSCSYVCDFVYRTKDGVMTFEDTKGVKTPEYVIKRKLALFLKGIRIKES